jgi:hypothetical protein
MPRQEIRLDGPERTSDRPAVISHGTAGPGDLSGRRRGVGLVAGIGRDRRLGPVVAGLGAVAVFASLVGEWTITSLPNSEQDGISAVQVPAGVGEVGNFGIAYLVGVFGVVGCLALVLFGVSPAVRHNARVIGVATTGALLALLSAATYTLDDAAERRAFYPTGAGFRIEYGRGLVMAFVGTACLGLALYLAGRFIPQPAGLEGNGERGSDDLPEGMAHRGSAEEGGWPWRRRRPGAESEPDGAYPAPADLTVTPAVPFARPEQQDGR